VRVEFDTVDPDHYRFLLGTGMLAVCSGWMAPAIRRFGLEIVPPADLVLEHEIASMRRAGGDVSPICARGWRNCCSSARAAPRSNLKWGAVLVLTFASAAGGRRTGHCRAVGGIAREELRTPWRPMARSTRG
jgi:hypothetical protein